MRARSKPTLLPALAAAPLAAGLLAVGLLAGGLLTASGLQAQEFRYLAFGDSITFGSFDEAQKGGYPGRLGPLLGCVPGVCSVENQGAGGEKTGAGVTRIKSLLNAKRYDVVLIMEGTNDIFKSPPISNNTIQFNLERMAANASLKKVDSILASIIWFHPDGSRGNSRDDEVQDLKNRLQGLAASKGYYFANPWAVLCQTRSCFNQHYFSGVPSPDPVGHPDASGYDILTGVFQNSIRSVPPPVSPAPVSPADQLNSSPSVYTWTRESPQRATWYQVAVDGAGGNLFNNWYRGDNVCTGATCSIVVQLNLPPGNYSWRTRGRNPAGRSAWSPGLAFSVQQGQGPTLTHQAGSCTAAPSGTPSGVSSGVSSVVIAGANFPANSEVGVVMAGGNGGFVKGGTACNGASFEISEPFVLPPDWVTTDPAGAFTVQITGEKCFVQALAVTTCQVSNLLVLPQ